MTHPCASSLFPLSCLAALTPFLSPTYPPYRPDTNIIIFSFITPFSFDLVTTFLLCFLSSTVTRRTFPHRLLPFSLRHCVMKAHDGVRFAVVEGTFLLEALETIEKLVTVSC